MHDARQACQLDMRRPTAVVAPFARPIPPSVKVMPHDTGGDGARNLLALRFAPRSSWFERSRLRPLALVLLVVRDARAAAAARSGAAGGARRSRGCGRSLWCCWRCATLARLRPLALVLLAMCDARSGAGVRRDASTTTERSEVGAPNAGVASRAVWHYPPAKQG
jgi:hypothetical protein